MLERQVDKINRTVYFMFAQIFDPLSITGANNTWIYDRAPNGYKFVLSSVTLSTTKENSRYNGIFAIYDGHEYTHWNQYPGVESRELLGRMETNQYQLSGEINLNNWECKEFTLGLRCTHEEVPFKACIIVWYYLRKMSFLERLQYAVMQPRGERYRKGGPSTVELSESEG